MRALGARNTKLNRNTIKRFFVSAVKRVYEPGARANFIVIFNGPQTVGKTPLLRILAREPTLFTDTPILRLNSQRRQEALRGKHIVEIAEMEGWKSATVEHLKALTSATHDYGRRPWDKCNTDQARTCIFACTTNNPAPLRDVTGNFRFPMIEVPRRINLEMIEENLDQIWAHAKTLYLEGFSLDLPRKLHTTLSAKQMSQMEDEPWSEKLSTLPAERTVNGEERVRYDAVFAHLGLTLGRTSQADAARASEAMQRLGWSRPKPCNVNGKTVRCFFRKSREKQEGEHGA